MGADEREREKRGHTATADTVTAVILVDLCLKALILTLISLMYLNHQFSKALHLCSQRRGAAVDSESSHPNIVFAPCEKRDPPLIRKSSWFLLSHTVGQYGQSLQRALQQAYGLTLLPFTELLMASTSSTEQTQHLLLLQDDQIRRSQVQCAGKPFWVLLFTKPVFFSSELERLVSE